MSSKHHKIFKSLVLLTAFFIALIYYGCTAGRYASKHEGKYSSESPSASTIRVLMEDSRGDFNYKVKTPVILMKENTPVAVVKNGNIMRFSADGNNVSLSISGKSYSSRYFQIHPAVDKSSIIFKGKRYKGRLKFINDGGKIRIINSVDLEDYVKGVIPAEMPTGSEKYFQALKAFAICVRTYAVNKLKGPGADFDVYLDTRDQVYGGISREKTISNRAAQETKNIILGYAGKPAIVFYSAECGGHTEKASNIFSVPDLPYLRGVRDGEPPNCSIAPHFKWTVTFTEKQFIKRLYEAGLIPDESYFIKKVEIADKDESGRVDDLLIILSNKERYEKRIILKSDKIRYVLKPPRGGLLRSTLFNIFTGVKNDVIIKGKGYGHGVGLCQWGSLHLSKEGKNYKYILSFYFPGTELMELR